jgi:hypothetical protein
MKGLQAGKSSSDNAVGSVKPTSKDDGTVQAGPEITSDETQTETHIGFDKLSSEIQNKEGYGKERADAVAAKIGMEKYGKKAMEAGAHGHHPVGESFTSSRHMTSWFLGGR